MKPSLLALAVLSALGLQSAFADAVTANYRLAPGAKGTEDIIGPFDTYDAGAGVALVSPLNATPVIGSIVDTYYQAHLQGHQLNGVTLVPTGLNTNYEITLVASFKEQVTGFVNNTVTSAVIPGSGTARVFFDPNPNYNYVTDTGFTDGSVIITGNILSGTSALTNVGVGAVGFEALTNIAITSYDTNVFSPGLLSANGIFTLSTFGTSIAGVTSVLGHPVGNDLLISADGNITFATAPVPVPAAVWLLGSALAGVGAIGRRRVTA